MRAADDPRLAAAPPLGALPLVVLASSQSVAMTPNWLDAQRRQAALSSIGELQVVEKSSHFIQFDRPDIVIASVLKVVTEARAAR